MSDYTPDDAPPVQFPSIWQQAANVGRAVVKHATSGFAQATDDIKAQRLAICRSCYFDRNGRCGSCGCRLDYKASWATSQCPEGKWPGDIPKQIARADEIAAKWIDRRPLRWACAITTAPRSPSTLERSALSLQATGFEPLLCAEPGTEIPPLLDRLPRIVRAERLGAFGNWIQTLRDLLENFPDAEALLIAQDDVIYAPDLKRFLEHDLWPANDVGCVSIYSPDKAGYEDASGPQGCRPVDSRWLIGACALVFPRDVARQIVDHELATNWRGRAKGEVIEPTEKKAVDTFVGHVLAELNRRPYFYNPSFAQHIADRSTLGHGGATGIRRSGTFAGEDVSPFSLLAGSIPAKRFNLDGTTRGRGWTPSGRPVTVVIPAKDCLDLTSLCLQHLALYRDDVPLRVVYVDNGSAPGTVEQLEELARSIDLPFRAIRNETNLGYTKAVNQGMVGASRTHILLLNNDCFVGPGCLRNMLRHLETTPHTASVGPLTTDGGHQSLHLDGLRQMAGLPAGELPERDPVAMAALCTRRESVPQQMLAFFCTMLHADAFAKVGFLLDVPEFESGLAADDEWCERAAKYGLVNRLVFDAFALHLHSESFRRLGIDRRSLQKVAIQKLYETRG